MLLLLRYTLLLAHHLSAFHSTFAERQNTRIMYLMGGLDRDIGRYVGRCIGRCVGRYSVEYRSSIGRYSAEISADSRSYLLSIGRVSVYTSTDMCVDRYGCNLADARPIPYRHVTDSLPIPYRHSVDTRSVYDLKSI